MRVEWIEAHQMDKMDCCTTLSQPNHSSIIYCLYSLVLDYSVSGPIESVTSSKTYDQGFSTL